MLEYLETKNLSDKEQPGSRPGKSTVTAGVAVTELKQNIVDSNDKRRESSQYFSWSVMIVLLKASSIQS